MRPKVCSWQNIAREDVYLNNDRKRKNYLKLRLKSQQLWPGLDNWSNSISCKAYSVGGKREKAASSASQDFTQVPSAPVPLFSSGGVFCHSQESSWAETGKILLPATTVPLQMSASYLVIGLQTVNDSCALTVKARNFSWDKWSLLPPGVLLKAKKK